MADQKLSMSALSTLDATLFIDPGLQGSDTGGGRTQRPPLSSPQGRATRLRELRTGASGIRVRQRPVVASASDPVSTDPRLFCLIPNVPTCTSDVNVNM